VCCVIIIVIPLTQWSGGAQATSRGWPELAALLSQRKQLPHTFLWAQLRSARRCADRCRMRPRLLVAAAALVVAAALSLCIALVPDARHASHATDVAHATDAASPPGPPWQTRPPSALPRWPPRPRTLPRPSGAPILRQFLPNGGQPTSRALLRVRGFLPARGPLVPHCAAPCRNQLHPCHRRDVVPAPST
jgi:hypothetical protein